MFQNLFAGSESSGQFMQYDYRTLHIRKDLADAIERAWVHIASPGTWWTGAQRVQMAAEVRQALSCGLCARRKKALSPYTVAGDHDTISGLPAVVVDAIHRIRTDPSRLTESWLHKCYEQGLTDAEYVEIVGVVATMTGLDTFSYAIGQPLRPLPEPLPGEPTRRRPQNAKKEIAWVPTLSPADLTPEDVDPFTQYGSVHIQRALSLVPESVIGFFDLDIALYLPQDAIRDFDTEYRAITHTQLEFIASKASAINGCYY